MLIAGAWHEWNNHVPKLMAVEGFTKDKLVVVSEVHLMSQGPLNDRQWAALLYTDHMSRAVSVPMSIFDKLKAAGFNDKEIVELTTVVGAYNMVGRVFVALDIAEANETKPKWLDTVK